MQYLHRWRHILLALTTLLVVLAVWLLIADILHRFIGRSPTYITLKRHLSYLVAPDMSLSGLFGFTFKSTRDHIIANTATLAIFFSSLWFFLGPQKDWCRAVVRRHFPTSAACCAALLAALITVGFVALALDWLGWWQSENALIICAVTATIASYVWFIKLRQPSKKYDRFIHLIVITYCLFVAAGVLTLIATPTQIYHHHLFQFTKGSYTAMILGWAVMLWTLIPSIALIWYSEHYRALTRGLCIKCMYNLKGTQSETCPECGHPIDRKIYENSSESDPPEPLDPPAWSLQ
jgi:hypothetical protein